MNTWTTLLTPTELEKIRTPNHAGRTKARTVQITRPDGTTQTFESTRQAALVLGMGQPTLANRCRTHHTDKQGNHYRYI